MVENQSMFILKGNTDLKCKVIMEEQRCDTGVEKFKESSKKRQSFLL